MFVSGRKLFSSFSESAANDTVFMWTMYDWRAKTKVQGKAYDYEKLDWELDILVLSISMF